MLERVTDLVARSQRRAGQKIIPIKIVLAERGGDLYSQTANYLRYLAQQARHGTAVLRKREIVPDAIDWNLVETVQANHSAGAQIADIVASAFYSAVRRPVEVANSEPAQCLRQAMATENGRVENYGLVLQPPPAEQEIDAIFKDIIRCYGYIL